MTNPLAKLKVDAWYSVVLVLSAFILVLSLTIDLKVTNQTVVQLASLGGVLIGLGELINHPERQAIIPPNILRGALKVTNKSWSPNWLGLFFDILGVGFALASAFTALL